MGQYRSAILATAWLLVYSCHVCYVVHCGSNVKTLDDHHCGHSCTQDVIMPWRRKRIRRKRRRAYKLRRANYFRRVEPFWQRTEYVRHRQWIWTRSSSRFGRCSSPFVCVFCSSERDAGRQCVPISGRLFIPSIHRTPCRDHDLQASAPPLGRPHRLIQSLSGRFSRTLPHHPVLFTAASVHRP